MPLQSFALDAGEDVTLDANGSAQLQLGPGQAGHVWRVRHMALHGVSAVDPLVKVYKGSRFVDGTTAGNLDASDCDIILNPGESLRIEWTGGSAGARQSFALAGEVIA